MRLRLDSAAAMKVICEPLLKVKTTFCGILQNVCYKKNKKNTEVCKISKSTWSKVFCLKQKQKYKNKTTIQDAVGYKANVFAPKQGYITLRGVWLGFKRGDSRLRQLLFNNGWVR